MKRLEVIANQSVQEEVLEGLAAAIPGLQYTLITPAYGAGARRKKLGDAVWPEVNFILVAYIQGSEAEIARDVLTRVKARFPDEGISFFEMGD